MIVELEVHYNWKSLGPAVERLRLERKYHGLMEEELDLGKSVSYVGNKTIPLLRLYRYKEAFSFALVTDLLKRCQLASKDYVFDPFSGMGTTLFVSMMNGIPSIGIDKLPIATFVSKALCSLFFIRQGKLFAAWEKLKQDVNDAQPGEVAMNVPIMSVAFSQEQLFRLRQWKSAINMLAQPWQDIFLLLFFSILESASYTCKDGQFLRLRRDKKLVNPDKALYDKVVQAEQDLKRVTWLFPNLPEIEKSNCLPEIYEGDTRELGPVLFKRPPTAIITSPPYVNRYDYTRSYSLELCFHFVRNFAELRTLRHSILRSHIESKLYAGEIPPHPAIKEAVEAIGSKQMNNPRIPFMLTAYFVDMQKAIKEWSRALARGARVAMVVDNVRFEGEIIPVDLVLSEMAEKYEFTVEKIIVSRYKGNSSQQMGKYGRIPVRESIVIWRKE